MQNYLGKKKNCEIKSCQKGLKNGRKWIERFNFTNFFREKKSQILQCFFVLGAKSFAKFAMVFRPRSNNGQIPYERHNLHWKLQPRPLLSEFFKDLIVMCIQFRK